MGNAIDDEIEDKLRSGEITINEAAAIGCGEIETVHNFEKKLKDRENNNDLTRTKIEMDLDRKAQRILAKTKKQTVREYVLKQLRLKKISMGFLPANTPELELSNAQEDEQAIDQEIEQDEALAIEAETEAEVKELTESTPDEPETDEEI